jgi:hypothetical protein
MFMNKDDWDKIKKYAEEVTSYDLMRQELDSLKGRVRKLEDEVENIDKWVEQHDETEDMWDTSAYIPPKSEPETILDHFKKLLPNSELEYFEVCPHQLDSRIVDLCDMDSRLTGDVLCAMCWHRLYSEGE